MEIRYFCTYLVSSLFAFRPNALARSGRTCAAAEGLRSSVLNSAARLPNSWISVCLQGPQVPYIVAVYTNKSWSNWSQPILIELHMPAGATGCTHHSTGLSLCLHQQLRIRFQTSQQWSMSCEQQQVSGLEPETGPCASRFLVRTACNLGRAGLLPNIQRWQ